MKAIRIHGAKEARLEEVAEPACGADDVLIRVKAVAICATDVELYDGDMFYLTSGMTGYPFTPGHEWSGEVVEVGANVTRFKAGDAVVGECSVGCRQCQRCLSGRYHLCQDRTETGILKRDGGMAEYIAHPQFFAHKVDGLEYEQAAFIEPTGIALNAVRRAGVTPADRVAVFGDGPIGLFAVQVARAYGARQVALVGGREERLQAGKDLGAHTLIDFRDGRVGEQALEATGGALFDVVIEAVGRKSVWPLIASVISPGSRVAMLGLFAGEKCEVDFDPLVVQDVSVIGCLGGPGLWPEAISLHRRGLVQAERMLTHRFGLEAFEEAIEVSRSGRDGAIKVLLEP